MRRNGFTLVEILVAVSIIVVIGALGLASYSQFNRRQILEQTVSSIISDMRLAQSLATNQEKPSGCSNFSGYAFNGTSNSYTIDSLCGTPTTYKSVSLSGLGISLSGLSKIEFRILGRAPIFTGGRTLTVTGSSGSKTITVGESGDITSN